MVEYIDCLGNEMVRVSFIFASTCIKKHSIVVLLRFMACDILHKGTIEINYIVTSRI